MEHQRSIIQNSLDQITAQLISDEELIGNKDDAIKLMEQEKKDMEAEIHDLQKKARRIPLLEQQVGATLCTD